MRSVRLTRLAILALLVGGPWVSAKEPGGKPITHVDKEVRAARIPALRTRIVPASPGGEAVRTWTVEGWGKTNEDAWQQALENARTQLLLDFAHREEPLLWRPGLDFIGKLVKSSTRLEAEDFGGPVQRAEGVRLVIEVTPAHWQQILLKDRELRSEGRMLVLGRILIGLVAVLGAMAGYLRLEEMTKGYYTAWLRLAALGFVTAVGAGIWWIS